MHTAQLFCDFWNVLFGRILSYQFFFLSELKLALILVIKTAAVKSCTGRVTPVFMNKGFILNMFMWRSYYAHPRERWCWTMEVMKWREKSAQQLMLRIDLTCYIHTHTHTHKRFTRVWSSSGDGTYENSCIGSAYIGPEDTSCYCYKFSHSITSTSFRS